MHSKFNTKKVIYVIIIMNKTYLLLLRKYFVIAVANILYKFKIKWMFSICKIRLVKINNLFLDREKNLFLKKKYYKIRHPRRPKCAFFLSYLLIFFIRWFYVKA